jgi:hypothetical protein
VVFLHLSFSTLSISIDCSLFADLSSTDMYVPSSIFFVLVVIAAVATSDDHTIESDGYKSANEQYTLVQGFEYPKQPDLPYPTCKLKKGLEIDGLSDALQFSASDNSLSDAGELL